MHLRSFACQKIFKEKQVLKFQKLASTHFNYFLFRNNNLQLFSFFMQRSVTWSCLAAFCPNRQHFILAHFGKTTNYWRELSSESPKMSPESSLTFRFQVQLSIFPSRFHFFLVRPFSRLFLVLFFKLHFSSGQSDKFTLFFQLVSYIQI